jgi:Domain of unknown function (DUF4407)
MSENNNSIGMNELVDYQKKTYSPFMDKVMKFLWKCGGADAQILQYAPYSDHIKNAGIGGVVLATTVMATLAMGFAMHTIFGENDKYGHHGNWFVTIPVALIWGLIIFNLDRFIVSTVKGDGTEKITGSEWVSMMPRLFMAILIGLTISAPLETYIFQKEIVREWGLSMDQLAISKKYEIEQVENKFNAEINDKVAVLEKDAKDQDLIVQKWAKAYEEEASGMRGGRGIGPEAKAMKLELDKATAKLNVIEHTRDSLRKIQKSNENLIKHKQDSVMNLVKKEMPGFLDQIMMLERLSSTGKTVPKFDPATNKIVKGEEIEIYGSAFWPIWLVRLLFMIVEIAPVIFKFMIWKSSYDYMQDNVSQILEAKQGISLELIPDENNNLHKVKENYNARRIVEVAKRQNELEKENAIHAITLYAEKEREEIEKDPERFIQGDSNEENKG